MWHGSLPLALLAVLSLLSVGAHVAWLGEPCRSPCRSASDHILIFDETYYVNAARVIAGLHPPSQAPYSDSPLGSDPNSEHPQLGKLVMAGSIELLGDGPFAWRLGSVVLGTVCIVGMFALVAAAGGGPWLGLGAATLLAADNLMLVHGRIGTLDVYALAAMICGAALYLSRRPSLAGAAIGIGACGKVVALYALLVLGLLEGTRSLASHGELRLRLRSLGAASASAVAVFLALLALLDFVALPYDASAGKLLGRSPFAHLGHMVNYASHQTSPHGPHGIASYPWQWLGDYKPIVYLNIDPAHPGRQFHGIHPAVHFLGMISPPILLLALPALLLAARSVVRRIPRPPSEVSMLGLAWFAGTFIPFELLSLVWSRTSYLYYMVIVMPGVYLVVADLVARLRARPRLRVAWIVAVAVAAIVMYPFTPLP